jgi:hypothetical protein
VLNPSSDPVRNHQNTAIAISCCHVVANTTIQDFRLLGNDGDTAFQAQSFRGQPSPGTSRDFIAANLIAANLIAANLIAANQWNQWNQWSQSANNDACVPKSP